MSLRTGRNDPCPCGSGKKFKKCCVDAGARGVPGPAPALEAGVDPVALAARLHALDRELVDQMFTFGARFANWTPKKLFPIDLDAEPAVMALFAPWAVYELRDDKKRSVAAFFRAQRASELSPEQDGWLAAQAQPGARLGIWEVIDATPGYSLRLRNALTHAERLVIERRGSTTLPVHDAILARVVDFGGISVVCGMHPRSLPSSEAQRIARGLFETVGGAHARRLDERTVDREELHADLIQLWELILAEMAKRPMPELKTIGGEDLVPITETFTIVDPADADRVREALVALPLAQPDKEIGHWEDGETHLAFVREGAPGSQLETTVLGQLTITGTTLEMRTLSRERAERYRNEIERACGPRVAFVSREEQDPVAMLPAAQALLSRAPIPPAAAAATRQLKSHMYRVWCDQALPALDGKTPRQAAKGKNKKLRDEVELLLCAIEQTEAALHPSERFDVGELRSALGLVSSSG